MPIMILMTQTQNTQPVCQLGLKHEDKGNTCPCYAQRSLRPCCYRQLQSPQVSLGSKETRQRGCLVKITQAVQLEWTLKLAWLLRGMEKPNHFTLGFPLSYRGRHLAHVCFLPQRSSRLCEGCRERGQQGDSNRGWAAWGGGRRRLPAPGCLQGTAQPLPPSEWAVHCPLLTLWFTL